MPDAFSIRRARRAAPLLVLALLAGCSRMPRLTPEDCMARAMYFESNRSSQEGMVAVGTVVMNRVQSGRYPKSVCSVVGQKKQFAPGVLSKKMGKGRDLAYKTARLVLRGRRHKEVGKAMFFHTAGYSYPYTNMHYVTIAGGNAFYEKRRNATSTQESVKLRREGRLRFVPPQRAAQTIDPARYGDDSFVRQPLPPEREPDDLRNFSNEWTVVATDTPLPPPQASPSAPDFAETPDGLAPPAEDDAFIADE